MRHYDRLGRKIWVSAEDPTGDWRLTIIVHRRIADKVFDLISEGRYMSREEMVKICQRYNGKVVLEWYVWVSSVPGLNGFKRKHPPIFFRYSRKESAMFST